MQVFERCGIGHVLSESTKNVIVHEIIAYDAIGRISRLLIQLISGLHTLGLLKVMRAFPILFLPLFVFTGCISPDDVLASLYVEQNISEEDEVIIRNLHRYICESSETALKRFLIHCTGSLKVPRPKSIRVELCKYDDNEHPAIASHTCDYSLCLPSGCLTGETDFDLFSLFLAAVIGNDDLPYLINLELLFQPVLFLLFQPLHYSSFLLF